jgi:hypothetical protein
MKKLLPLYILFAAFTSNAQTFTLTQAANEPVIGDSSRTYVIDTTAQGNINAGNGGINITWNLSSLNATGGPATTTWLDPTSVPSATAYPGCTIVSKQGSVYSYYKAVSSPSTQLEFMGVTSTSLNMNFTNTAIYQRYPFAFSNNLTDNFSGNFTFSLSGTANGSGTTVAEGTGTLILPSGTYNNVLKIRSSQSTTLNAVFINGTIKQTIYSFYHSSQKYPLLSVNYQTITVAGSPTVSAIVNGNANNFTVGLKELKADEASLQVYPNPATQALNIQMLSPLKPTGMRIVDQSGHEIYSGEFSAKTDISKWNAGMYYLEIKTAKGTVTRKFIKE